MTTLHLGVLDIPYADESYKKMLGEDAAKNLKGHNSVVTTGDVAEILEAKYGVLDGFLFLHLPDIAEDMAESVAGAIDSLMAGAPVDKIDPFASGTSKIEEKMKDYLSKRETELAGLPGVPTGAAQRGESKRFKRHSGPPRPSFIDTGLYQSTLKAWVEPT